MKTLVSFQALTAALAASLGLQACGGETSKLKDGPSGTGGRDAETGGDTATSQAGGIANTGGVVSLGNAGSAETDRGGGGGTGGGFAIQGGFSGMRTPGPAPCDSLSPNVNYKGEPTGIESCRDQTTHRVSNAACAVYVPRADWTCRGGSMPSCATDADCNEKPLGACVAEWMEACDCQYRCRTDEDCADGGICFCEGDAGKCLPATCRTDADCGEGLQCRSYQHPDSENCEDVRYECQTAEDTCDSSYEDCHGGERCISDATGVHQCRQHYCYYE
jgi:hypothetical protein